MDVHLAREIAAVDAAVAGPQCEPPGHVFDVDRSVAAPGGDIRIHRRRDNQLRGTGGVEVKAHSARLHRFGFDGDPVPALLRADVDGRGGLAVDRALFNHHLDVRLVPGADFDRAVEGIEGDVRRPRGAEVLRLAFDEPGVRADEVDTCGPAQQRGHRNNWNSHKRLCCDPRTSVDLSSPWRKCRCREMGSDPIFSSVETPHENGV